MSLCFMLTAGRGTRLKPYTDTRAKPTLPLLNMPLAHYGFYLARQGGFEHFLMNKHHLPTQVEKLAQSLSDHCREIQTVDETAQLLGSGGALWNARDILHKHEFFMIANGDEVMIPRNERVLNHLVHRFQETGSLACLLTCDHPDLLKTLKPVWTTPDQTVVGFGMNKPPGDPRPKHYTGYKVFSRKILDWLPNGESNIFYEVLTEALHQGEDLFHLPIEDVAWFETGNPTSFFNASNALASHHWAAVQQRRRFFGWKRLYKFENKGQQLVTFDSYGEARLKDVAGHVVIGDHVHWPTEKALDNCIVFPQTDLANPESAEAGVLRPEPSS